MIADTIEPSATYAGYRLFISDIGIYQVKSNWMRIQYKATNTGSESITTDKRSAATHIQFRFDKSLEVNRLEEYKGQIVKVLQYQKIDLQPGEQSEIKYLKFFTNAATYGMEDKIEEIVEAVPIVEKTTSEPQPKTASNSNSNQDIKTSSKNERSKGGKSNSSTAQAAERTTVSTEELLREKKYCPDLVIEEVKILEQSKRWLTLEFSIRNQGRGIAHLFGTERHERDNLAIMAYMSGSDKLTRGAISLGGMYVTKGEGALEPDEAMRGTIRLDIRTKTRYTPVVILSLDAYQTARECDRTNNTAGILVE